MAVFLLAEDPQRRLDAHKAATLMHQISLVQHILNQPDLRKVMIGDEVGWVKLLKPVCLSADSLAKTQDYG